MNFMECNKGINLAFRLDFTISFSGTLVRNGGETNPTNQHHCRPFHPPTHPPEHRLGPNIVSRHDRGFGRASTFNVDKAQLAVDHHRTRVYTPPCQPSVHSTTTIPNKLPSSACFMGRTLGLRVRWGRAEPFLFRHYKDDSIWWQMKRIEGFRLCTLYLKRHELYTGCTQLKRSNMLYSFFCF